MALFFVFYALAPAMLGASLAYLAHGQDRLSALGVGLVMVVLSWLTHTRGHRWLLHKVHPDAHWMLNLIRWSGLAMAPIYS